MTAITQNTQRFLLENSLPQSAEIIYEEILDYCRQVHHMETVDVEALEVKMHSILEQLSEANRFNLIRNVAEILQKHGFTFDQEPTVPLLIMDTEEKIQIPFSLFVHSKGLQNQFDEEDPTIPHISLPWRFTKEGLEMYCRFLGEKAKPIRDLTTWLLVRITAERFACDDEIINTLVCKKPLCRGTLEELETILFWYDDLHPVIAGEIASKCLNMYINTALKSSTPMKEICETLSKSKLIKNRINTIPIDLALNARVTESDLIALATVLQNVVSLKVNISDVTVFPILWTNTLLKLEVPFYQIREIPEALLNRLNKLTLNMTQLQDYTVLNNRPNLKELHLCGVANITAVPSGCVNLKVFEASLCPQLQNYSALNGLPFLEKCRFSTVPITAVPLGCPNLKIFEAGECPKLRDYSGLNNLPSLQECRFSTVPITAVPLGCPNLKIFEARECPELRDYSGLNNLPSLQEFRFSTVPITAVPLGCPNLKIFEARECPELRDYSGLNGLRSLKKCVFYKVPITAAPSGCPNLKIFGAEDCLQLRDYSALNGLRSLKECIFYKVPITAAPSGCPNLRIFLARGCPELRDCSALNGLKYLNMCDFESSPLITAAPSGCPNLTIVDGLRSI